MVRPARGTPGRALMSAPWFARTFAASSVNSGSRLKESREKATVLPHHEVTVNALLLVALPPGVVITILLVFAPLGTTKVTCVSELTV